MCDQLTSGESVEQISEEQVQKTARKLYTPIKTWQTRVLKLHAGKDNDVLEADLLVAGLAHLDGLVIDMAEDLVSYEAISYSWGERTSYIRVVCNGLEYGVNPSLAGALKRFRYLDRERYIWADALCINQADDVEKSVQVRSMFTVYRKAQRVLAWLGEETQHTAEAVRCLISARRHHNQHFREHYHKLSVGGQAGLRDLYNRPWNRRVWIQQEVFAAQEVRVFCGAHSVSLDAYNNRLAFRYCFPGRPYSGGRRLRMAGEDELSALEGARRRMRRFLNDSRQWPTYEKKLAEHGLETRDMSDGFEIVLYRSATLEASDPRDLIYALLSLTNHPIEEKHNRVVVPELCLAIDYSKDLITIFHDVTRYIMNRDESLLILQCFGKKSTQALRIPSWVVDWTSVQHIKPEPLDRNSPRIPLGRQKSIFGNELRLRGLVIGEIASWVFTSGRKPKVSMSFQSHLTVKVQGYRDSAEYSLVWSSSTEMTSSLFDVREDDYTEWPGVEVSDLIVQVDGSDEPLLLRPLYDGCYIFVRPLFYIAFARILPGYLDQNPQVTCQERKLAQAYENFISRYLRSYDMHIKDYVVR